MTTMQNKIVAIAAALIVVAAIVPVAINQFVDVDTSGWTGSFAALATLWPVIAILAVVGLALLFINSVSSKGKG